MCEVAKALKGSIPCYHHQRVDGFFVATAFVLVPLSKIENDISTSGLRAPNSLVILVAIIMVVIDVLKCREIKNSI